MTSDTEAGQQGQGKDQQQQYDPLEGTNTVNQLLRQRLGALQTQLLTDEGEHFLEEAQRTDPATEGLVKHHEQQQECTQGDKRRQQRRQQRTTRGEHRTDTMIHLVLERDEGAVVGVLHVIGAAQCRQGAGDLVGRIETDDDRAVYQEDKRRQLHQLAQQRKIQ